MHFKCIEPEKIYEQDPKLKPEDVKIMQEWLKKQPHLPVVEESQILFFLHSSNNKIELAKTTLDAYFTQRTHYPEIFHYPGDDAIKNALSFVFKKVLPRKTPDGNVVFLSKLLDYRPEKYNYIQDVLLVHMIGDLNLYQNGVCEGVISILDFKGGSLGHLSRVNFQAMKHAFDYIQEGMPTTVKETHIINTVPFMDTVMGIIKPILKSELFNTIHLHSSLESLYKYVPKECLPEDYGGDLPSCQILQEETTKDIFDNVEFFKWRDSQTVDETKRIEKSKMVQSNFGMDGTFKKLELD